MCRIADVQVCHLKKEPCRDGDELHLHIGTFLPVVHPFHFQHNRLHLPVITVGVIRLL